MRSIALSLVISCGFALIAASAIRHQKLRDQTALLWLVVSVAMLCLSITLPFHLLDSVAHFVGIAYPPDFVLVIAVIFLGLLVFQLSAAFARLTARYTRLVQEVGLLAARDGRAVRHDEAEEPGGIVAGAPSARARKESEMALAEGDER